MGVIDQCAFSGFVIVCFFLVNNKVPTYFYSASEICIILSNIWKMLNIVYFVRQQITANWFFVEGGYTQYTQVVPLLSSIAYAHANVYRDWFLIF